MILLDFISRKEDYVCYGSMKQEARQAAPQDVVVWALQVIATRSTATTLFRVY
jgi:hypothetical protein